MSIADVTKENDLACDLLQQQHHDQSDNQRAIHIGIIAGEISGDKLAGGLIKAIKEKLPNARFSGVGGSQMAAAGCDNIHSIDALSVMGLDGVIKGLPRILKLRKHMINYFVNNKPDLFIGVDAPDFNLGFERVMHKNNIDCIHYVSPTVWAWREGRVKTLQKYVKRILVLFPFEKQYYADRGVKADFVGHPMAFEIAAQTWDKAQNREALDLNIEVSDQQPVLALLPGSRSSEINFILPIMLETVKQLHHRHPAMQFLLSAAHQKFAERFEKLIQQQYPDLPIHILSCDVRKVIAAADLAIATSGTVTMETALIGRPFVAVYKGSRASEWMARTFIKVKNFAMPNFLIPTPDIPEFFQDDLTPDNVAKEVEVFLSNPEKGKKLCDDFAVMAKTLAQDAHHNSAQVIVDFLNDADRRG